MSESVSKESRRRFLKASSIGLPIAAITTRKSRHATAAPPHRPRDKRLPREVWVASISQNKMTASNYDQMIRQMLQRMAEVVCYEPDIICLPEVFPFVNLDSGRPPIAQVAESPIGEISTPFARFAQKHNCNVICPIYTRQDGKYYNAAVFIDRQGNVLGQYHKMHPTIGEMENGVTPGTLEPTVIQTDVAKIGAQICFDIQWDDGWQKLSRAGAEIVFWPSAFGGGILVNTKAWQNGYCVVSSTRKGTTKICDVTGEVVAQTGQWDRWVCAALNLEKAFISTWPYVRQFSAIRKKYGRKVRIRTWAEEEWTILESRDPEIKIADVLREFDFKTLTQDIGAADRAQRQARRG